MKSFIEFLAENNTAINESMINWESSDKDKMKKYVESRFNNIKNIFKGQPVKVRFADGWKGHDELCGVELINSNTGKKITYFEIYGYTKHAGMHGMSSADKIVATWEVYSWRNISSTKSIEDLMKKIEKALTKKKDEIESWI